MSVRVNIFETLPINKIKVPQLRGNDVEQNHNSSKINFTTILYDNSHVNVCLSIAAENEIAKIIRTNETVVSVVYEPTKAQQMKISKDGLQGQFVVQYDVDRSSIERKGGEIHVIKNWPHFYFFVVIWFNVKLGGRWIFCPFLCPICIAYVAQTRHLRAGHEWLYGRNKN